MKRYNEFKKTSESIDSLDALFAYFGEFILQFGFYAFTLGSAPLKRGAIDTSGAVLHSTLPPQFQEEYHEDNMATVDVVFELTASRYMPFTKSEIETFTDHGPQERDIMELADRFDIGDAMIVPIATVDAARGVLFFSREPADVFKATLEKDGSLLHLIALQMMSRAEALGFGKPTIRDVILTKRERQCLQRCAQGKTSEAIGTALGISERTVRFHITNAGAKLGASKRSQAVSLALQYGLIRL